MKTLEDEAFDELARRQGAWGGGFPAKRAMAADKLQEPDMQTGIAYQKGFHEGKQATLALRPTKVMYRPADLAAIGLTHEDVVNMIKEPVSFPCCGYTDANAIRWNQFNGVVQCHMCGQVYTVAQPAQEPVAWRWGIKKLNGGYEWRYTLNKTRPDSIPLYAAPAQRQWIWLSDSDIADVMDTTCQYTGGYEEFLIKKAERKIKELNT